MPVAVTMMREIQIMPKIMILGASALQVPAIEAAKRMGYETIVIDYDPDAVGFAIADVKLVISTIDMDAVLEAAKKYEPDVIITSTSDAPVRTAAYVNEQLGKRPDLSYEDSKRATIKSYMRDRLREHGLPIPQYYVCKNRDEYEQAVKQLDYKAIVKPADNAGSRGVTLLDSKDEKVIRDTYEYSLGNSRQAGDVLVEEYMTGREVSVESMTIDGETTVITITDKHITPPPFFVELGHNEASTLDDAVKQQIIEITKKAAAAIGMKNCPSHTEMKITPDGPKIVEIAARLGGDFITSKLVPLSTGVDMVGSSVALACGRKVDITKKWDRGAAIYFISAANAVSETDEEDTVCGVIKDISVPEEYRQDLDAHRDYLDIDSLRSAEGIQEIVLYKNVGDEVHGTESSNDRLGHVIAVGKDATEAYELAQSIGERIRFVIEKGSNLR